MVKLVTITKKQALQFNEMQRVLTLIAKGYQSPLSLQRNSERQYGLNYLEALEMSYQNIQLDAKRAAKGVRSVEVQP